MAKAGNAQEKAELKKDYTILLGVLRELLNYRYRFLAEGRFIDLFPATYFHTTAIEMERIAAGQFQYPIEKMKQMIAFYDAYIWNRALWDQQQKSSVEAHWKAHFEYSEEKFDISGVNCLTAVHVLATAIEAHVRCDLPRAIHYAYQNRYDRTLASANTAYTADFSATDAVFKQSLKRMLADLSTRKTLCFEKISNALADRQDGVLFRFYKNEVVPYFNMQPIYTDKDVVNMRHAAWATAFSGKPFTDLKGALLLPQPVLDHSALEALGAGFMASQPDKSATPRALFTVKEFTLPGNAEKPVETDVQINENDYVYVDVSGQIVTGPMLGPADGSGLLESSLFSGLYNKYDLRHGSVALLVGDDVVGCKKIFRDLGALYNAPFTPDYGDRVNKPFFGVNYIPGIYFLAKSSGKLKLDVNDTRPDNNTGEFRVRVFVLPYEAHQTRNTFNKCPLREPENELDCRNGAWKKESIKSWIYHGINDSYRGRSTNKGCQCVYDDGVLLTSGDNQGSFDIAYWLFDGKAGTPDADYYHLILDVIPHDLYKDLNGQMEYNATNGVKCAQDK